MALGFVRIRHNGEDTDLARHESYSCYNYKLHQTHILTLSTDVERAMSLLIDRPIMSIMQKTEYKLLLQDNWDRIRLDSIKSVSCVAWFVICVIGTTTSPKDLVTTLNLSFRGQACYRIRKVLLALPPRTVFCRETMTLSFRHCDNWNHWHERCRHFSHHLKKSVMQHRLSLHHIRDSHSE